MQHFIDSLIIVLWLFGLVSIILAVFQTNPMWYWGFTMIMWSVPAGRAAGISLANLLYF